MLRFRPVPYFPLLAFVLVTTVLTAQGRIGSDGIQELDPVLSASGRELYLTRPDHPRNQGTEDRADIWVRTRTPGGGWSRALNPGSPVNTFGDDRLLSSSVDGNRIAVLREDRFSLELLEREGRSWRIIGRWSLPADARELEEITFNATGQEMIYGRRNADNGSYDLYLRRALAGGEWTPPRPLSWLNTYDNETKPQWAADGRTLYFRRGAGQWYRQEDRGTAPRPVDIPSRYLQLAVTDELLVATTDDLGNDERLVMAELPLQVLCRPGRISYGTLGNPPAGGASTVPVPLSSGIELWVRPDVLHRYAVVVREDEVAFPESNMPSMENARPAGSLASLREIAAEDREAYLQRTLAERQRELAKLDAIRQQRYIIAKNSSSEDDPWTTGVDTLPPATADTTASFRARYARELAELERMKAKFRRQQEDRLRERQRGEYLDLGWSDRPVTDPDTASGVDAETLRATVRSGLYPPARTPVTDRRAWENDIRATVPRPANPADPARTPELDAEYARQLRELEALRAQLREMNGTPAPATSAPRYPSPDRPELTGKSPQAAVPNATQSRSTNAGITFIPNTAYPNAAGYTALDLLEERVRSAEGLVEIRVHTAPDTDARAAQLLSEERAFTIRQFLLDAGIAPANFRVTGYGNHQPAGGERVEILE